MICKNCGTNLPDGNSVCNCCGADLRQMAYISDDNFDKNIINIPSNNKPPKKSRKPLIVVAAVTGIVIAGVVIAGAFNKKKNVEDKVGEGIYIDGDFYAYSAEEGLENMKDIEFSCQVDNVVMSGRNMERVGPVEYHIMDGLKVTGEVTDSPNALLGYIRKFDSESKMISYVSKIIGVRESICPNEIITGEKVYEECIAYFDRDNLEQRVYPVMSFALVDNYMIDGLTKDSNENDIISAGYMPEGIKGMYVNFHSDKATDWSKIEEDYLELYNSGVTSDDYKANQFKSIIPYGRYYETTYNVLNTAIDSDNREYSINKEAEHSYNNLYTPGVDKADYKDVVMLHLALAQQLYYLDTGEIDYFIISVIETLPAEKDRLNSVQYIISEEAAEYFTYDDNVVRIYIVTNEDTMDKWLDNLE